LAAFSAVQIPFLGFKNPAFGGVFFIADLIS